MPSARDDADNPEQINEDPYGAGCLVEVALSDPSEADQLRDVTDFRNFLAEG